MRIFFLTALTALTALAVGTVSAAASATSASVAYGSKWSVACYQAADARVATQHNLAVCTQALRDETAPFQDLVASFVNRGVLHFLKGNVEQAERDFDAALKLEAAMPEAWLNKSVLFLNKGRSDKAREFAQKALDLRVENQALAYFVRGLAHEDRGEVSAAYADLLRAQQLAPRWGEPKNELARYKVVQRR